MADKIMDILAKETGGKSYKAYKYSLDSEEKPAVDYGDDTMVWERTAETDAPKTYKDLAQKCQQLLKYDTNLFAYFLDGSRRVFKVDDIAYRKGKRLAIYPVLAGQIGIGCCHRKNKKMFKESFVREWDLSIPDIADADGRKGFFQYAADKINACNNIQRLTRSFGGMKLENIFPYSTSNVEKQKYEDKGIACIQDRMIELEKEAVAQLVRKNKLGQEAYLIKDGSLEYRPSKQERTDWKKAATFKGNYQWVLGVSKNFNPEICKDIKGKANPGFIANLPLHSRTPVAQYDYCGTKFAVWYVRLQPANRTRSTFSGIVKVEKMLMDDEEIHGIPTDDVDTLSANLINERTPTCYGSDLRWANHIYPIYLTEKYVKANYISTETFLHLF